MYKKTSIDVWLSNYHLIKKYLPKITRFKSEWIPNFDANLYAIAWSNPIYKEWEIYAQPFFDGHPNMDIFIFNSTCMSKPLLIKRINCNDILSKFKTGEISDKKILTIFLNNLNSNIEKIETEIQSMEYTFYNYL